MSKDSVNIIVAQDRNFGIGKDNRLLFKSKDDMNFFKTMTTGACVIMGRKTWESLPGKLKARKNVIISKSGFDPGDESVDVYDDLEKAIKANLNGPNKRNIFIIGGESIYKDALDRGLVTGIYKTIFDDSKEADTFFPNYSSIYALKRIQEFKRDDNNESSGSIFFHKIKKNLEL